MPVERRRARTVLVVTFLLFFLPIVGAWLLNVFAPDWRPFGTVNHGTLVQPVRPVPASGLADRRGGHFDGGYLSGRWTLVHVLSAPCGSGCLDALVRTRQVHRALGDDMNRVQRLLVAGNPAHVPGADQLPEIAFAIADRAWLTVFSFTDSGTRPGLGIYLVDPQGHVMMRYPADVDQRGLLADLERLLKISKIG